MTKESEEILNQRADQLEKIGFKLFAEENSVWYQKGEVKMNSILMYAASDSEWDKFIKENS